MLILKEIILFVLPVTLANIIHHWIIIPHNLFDFLAHPIDNNIVVGGHPLFGKNKTYRGFVVIILLTGVLFVIFNYFLKLSLSFSDFLSGAIYGLCYMLLELPNSFLKRRLFLNPGKHNVKFFSLIDEIDSIIGAIIALNFIYHQKLLLIILLLSIGYGLHCLTNILLYQFGYKKKSDITSF